ncbi:MAG: lipopolysaccharide heptosyltransferase II, partial [Candidatus Omnitrophota bacterium]
MQIIRTKIVIFRTDRVGEVLLASSVIDCVKTAYPQADITFVTSEYARDIIDGRDDVSEVLTVDTFEKKAWFLKAIRLARILHEKHFDLAIVLNPHKILHLASFLAGIPLRAGYNRKWGFLLNAAIPDERDSGEKHEIEYNMDLLRKLNIETFARPPRLVLNKTAEKYVEELFARKGVDTKKVLITIHPGSSNTAKMWPKENYAEVTKRLKKEVECSIAIIGTAREKALADKIVMDSGGAALNFSGLFDLKQLAACLEKASVFIGNDTGPMHMAAALKVPVIALFGRKIQGVSPTRWRPWGHGHTVFHKDAGCSVCKDTKCELNYKCMLAITVEEVVRAAKETLKRKKETALFPPLKKETALFPPLKKETALFPPLKKETALFPPLKKETA